MEIIIKTNRQRNRLANLDPSIWQLKSGKHPAENGQRSPGMTSIDKLDGTTWTLEVQVGGLWYNKGVQSPPPGVEVRGQLCPFMEWMSWNRDR